MAKQVAQTGAIQKAQEEQAVTKKSETKTLKDLIEIRMPEIQKVLPSVITPTQFLRLTLNAIQNTPHLQECTMQSFYGSVMQCAQLGLKPNVNGEGYLIPYKNYKKGGVYECQFITGYKGLMLLARRSGEIASIDAQTVYENDEFALSYGFEPTLIHKPYLKGDRGKAIGFYAAVILKDGGKSAYYMTVDDAKKYGKRYSKAYDNSPWQTDFETMAKKSCLRQVLKYAPMSTDVESAFAEEDKFAEIKDAASLNSMIEVPDEVEEVTEEDWAEETVDSDGVVEKS